MSNNQNSIKNIIRKYFIRGDSDIKDFKEEKSSESVSTGYSPLKYKVKDVDISSNIKNPGMNRAMKALQLSNPFKGV